MKDPLAEDHGLASPTLAQVYLAQGHVEHARTTCKQVLEHDATNGYALALLERLRPVETATLSVRFCASSATGVDLGAGQLEFDWSVPDSLLELPGMPDNTRLDVVFAIAALRDASRGVGPALRYSSVRCLDPSGTHRLDAPLGPASAAVMLVLSPGPRRPKTLLSGHTRRPPARVLAVAEPLSW
ncbi:hypothetical protein DB30_05128 [Enhygromyxa salina]|uniref:Tetratricopeptide repeat protein n=1 Tax=Enhygromyxa salina TaxID=215803 RepID=A0A0C2D7C9_9BACT|nr:tetratricopeptide repeat protein [Enhygromyxa salina]KIG15937.1 hypothetical protein DB30_05128 [Enhygromyxa salina]